MNVIDGGDESKFSKTDKEMLEHAKPALLSEDEEDNDYEDPPDTLHRLKIKDGGFVIRI